MKFIIDHKIFEKFPGLNIGVITAKEVDNSNIHSEIQEKIRLEEKRIRENYVIESLAEQPRIAVWRKAYLAFGAKPKDTKSSAENLYRLVLNGVNLRTINNLVDSYNFISLKYMLPAGGEDLDKIQGDVLLTLAGENEPPMILLGDKEPRTPHAGEVIYKDDLSSICRRWNWREADRTKLTETTKNCILVIEGLPPVTEEEIGLATKELSGLAEKYCGGKVAYAILNAARGEREI